MKDSKGFSLIELMIVIAIVNILASIALPNYMVYKSKANFSACIQSLHAIEIAELMHYLDNDTFTTSATDLAPWLRTPNQTEAGINEVISQTCNDWKLSESVSVTSDSYTITAKSKGKFQCTITIKEDGTLTPKSFSECRQQVSS
jgi:prepilin-type N-terminal cleavage/methylation domain-containing protein